MSVLQGILKKHTAFRYNIWPGELWFSFAGTPTGCDFVQQGQGSRRCEGTGLPGSTTSPEGARFMHQTLRLAPTAAILPGTGTAPSPAVPWATNICPMGSWGDKGTQHPLFTWLWFKAL